MERSQHITKPLQKNLIIIIFLLLRALLTYLLTPCSRVFLEKLTVLQLFKKFPTFMEPESSLPYSQVPATCPYPEPASTSPHNPLPRREDPS
jgi:hypothetical protein